MANYYVANSATGNGLGGDQSNYMTVASFNATTLAPGDTAYFSDSQGSFNQDILTVTDSGSSGSWITLTNVSGESPNFIGPTSGQWGWAISVENQSYIKIDGLNIDGQAISQASRIKKMIKFDGASHIRVTNGVFTRVQGSAGMFTKGTAAHYIEIDNSSITYVGIWDLFDYTGVHDDSGDGITTEDSSSYWYIHDNYMSHCGHSIMRPSINWLIDNNVMDGEWGVYSGPDFTHKQGVTNDGDVVGNRTGSFSNSDGSVIQNNIIKRGRKSVDNKDEGMFKGAYRNGLIRKNFIFDCQGPAVIVQRTELGNYGRTNNGNNRYVHNSLYNIGYSLAQYEDFGTPAGNANVDNGFVNNAIYLINQRTSDTARRNNFIVVKGGTEKWGNQWLDWFIENNCIGTDSTINVYSDAGSITLTTAETNFPAVFANNLQADPQFTTIPPTQKGDFALKATSPCIGAGRDLATVTSATGSGTVFTVSDSRCFFDGYGWIPGDSIKIGASTRTILSINHSANEITVDSSVSWTLGDAVNYAEYTTIDMGAVPDGGTTPATANNDVFDVDQNASVQDLNVLANDAGTGNTITSVSYTSGNGATVAIKTGGLFIEYTPGTGFEGQDQFSYIITDSSGDTSTATANISVNALNVSPNGHVIDDEDAGFLTTGDFADKGIPLSGSYNSDHFEVGEEA